MNEKLKQVKEEINAKNQLLLFARRRFKADPSNTEAEADIEHYEKEIAQLGTLYEILITAIATRSAPTKSHTQSDKNVQFLQGKLSQIKKNIHALEQRQLTLTANPKRTLLEEAELSLSPAKIAHLETRYKTFVTALGNAPATMHLYEKFDNNFLFFLGEISKVEQEIASLEAQHKELSLKNELKVSETCRLAQIPLILAGRQHFYKVLVATLGNTPAPTQAQGSS